MVENPISKDEELKELIINIRRNNQIRFFIFGPFLLLSLSLEWMGIMVPRIVAGIITLLLFVNLASEYFTKKIWPRQTVSQVSFGYFIIQLVEVLSLLLTIPFFEAVAFGGIALLLVYIIFSYLGFPQRIYPRIIALVATIGYMILGFLAHYGVLEYQNIYNIGASPMLNRPFFITNISFMVGFLICLALSADIFSRKVRTSLEALRARTEQLIQTEGELREAKETLEIKVQARTRELTELTKTLDERVKQRTQELQEKVGELEKFHKLAVGRELKMIELKEEIKKLKKTSNSKQEKVSNHD